MTITLKITDPQFFVRADNAEGHSPDPRSYFNYVATVQAIVDYLKERFGAEFHLYEQDDGNEIWNGLEEDVQNEYEGLEHAASLYDLVETRTFAFTADYGQNLEGYAVRPAIRNNLFIYSKHRVAMARVPKVAQHGLSYEDLIFSESDGGLVRFLEDMRSRQLADRKIIVFTDTRDGLEQSRELTSSPVDRAEVFMDEELKTQIYRSIDEFFAKDRSFFQTYGIPYKRGILLYGKPGNGKTTLVKSISGSIGAPVAYWQITEFTNSESIQEVFAAANQRAPMVLVIEDIDSMPASCRSYFLNTLDGATSKEGIYLIGTTNYPEKIDPALMNRAGRFDRAYEVKLPNEAIRHSYLIHKGMHRLVDKESVARAAQGTEGFTLAQLSELYVSAALQLHHDNEVNLSQLIAEMKSDYAKGRSRDWMTDGQPRRLGFTPSE